MDTLIEIGKRVRKTREHYKLTREQLAEMASISPQFLVHIENGTKSMTCNTNCKLDTDLNRTLATEALVSMLPEDREVAERVLQSVIQLIKAMG